MKRLLLPLLLLSLSASAAEPAAERQEELRSLLHQDCGACHGLTLKGGMGPPLLPDTLNGKTDEFLAETILNGRKGTPMPPWGQFISRNEAFWLIGILRHPEH
jgi:cytochrome c55X